MHNNNINWYGRKHLLAIAFDFLNSLWLLGEPGLQKKYT